MQQLLCLGVQVEVGKHEPWLALDGGQGPGLDSLNAICQEAARFLCPGGFLALEVRQRPPSVRRLQLVLFVTEVCVQPCFTVGLGASCMIVGVACWQAERCLCSTSGSRLHGL